MVSLWDGAALWVDELLVNVTQRWQKLDGWQRQLT